MSDLAGQGLVLIGMNAQLFRPGALTPRGTRAPAFVDALGELQLDPVMRTRMEAALRRFGATEDLSTLDARALIQRYMELQRSRAAVGEDIASEGATRGQGVYEQGPQGTQTIETVSRASRSLTGARAFAGENMRLENIVSTATNMTADLVVEVPGAATLTVRVTVEVVPALAAGGPHGPESGMARLTLAGDPVSGFRLRIELDSRIQGDADVRLNLGHELREGADLVRQIVRDPTTDVAAQQRAGIFGLGASTEVTSHARAAAPEFNELFSQLRTAIGAYDAARAAAARRPGRAPIPEAVRTAGEAAYRRLDAMLDAMGFADPATRAAKRAELLRLLNLQEGSPLTAYIDGYGERITARTAIQTALNAVDPAARAALMAGLGPDLAPYLLRRVPVAAVGVLSELMSRNLPGDAIRNVVRELLRQHRTARLDDAALTDMVTRVNQFASHYRDRISDPGAPENARDLTRAVQTESGAGFQGALARLEARIVQAGRAGPAGTATAGVGFSPEAELLGNQRHGIRWTQADATARSRIPGEDADQGRFGTLADVMYAVQCAAQQLSPQGTAASAGGAAPAFQGVFELPAWHTNVVYRYDRATNTSTVVPADLVYVNVRPDGTVHAYPGDRNVMNLNAFGGVAGIRPVVTY